MSKAQTGETEATYICNLHEEEERLELVKMQQEIKAVNEKRSVTKIHCARLVRTKMVKGSKINKHG